MKRKFLCLLLALTLLLGLAATVSATGDRITSGDWVYQLVEGKAVILDYTGTDADVVVPAKLDGYTVSEIGTIFSVFSDAAETMKTVTVSEGIGVINTRAFTNCTALEKAVLPASVRYIGSSAFEGCTSLSDVTLSEGLKTIQRYAFLNTGLTAIVIPASVTVIDEDSIGYTGEWGNTDQVDGFGIFGYTDTAAEEYARDWHFSFYRLEDMTDTSGRCGDNATWRFEESTGTLYIEGEDDTDPYYNTIQPWIAYADDIRRVVVGEGIDHLGDNSFAYHYPNLTEVELSSTVRALGNGCFRGCTGLTAIELPEKLTYIYGAVFANSGLRSIVLPHAEDVYSSYLGGSAFAGCADLENVFFAGNPWDFSDSCFQNAELTAWYPASNTAWSDYYLQQYEGDVTWNAYDPDLFRDVAIGSFYYDSVIWAVENGITNGISATEFDPNGQCQRGQIVTFLWRAAGCPVVEAENPFTDVTKDDFYYNAVLWAVDQGITTGTSETTFSPYKVCSRAEVVTFLWRAAGKPAASGTNPFTDVSKDDFFHTAVLWAVENGVTNGMDATHFSPYAVCNRAQVVTFLYRAKDIEPAARYSFELRSNDPTEEIGFAFCDGTEFAAGETVTFYAEPWFGYLVEFTAEPDVELELYYLGAYTYELVMPAHDLVLTANFVPAPGEAHNLSIDCENGMAFVVCDADKEGNSIAKAGEFLQIFIIPEEGFTFSPESFTATAGGQTVEDWWYLGEIVEEDPDLGVIDGIFVVELVMPDADLTVSVTCTPGADTAAAELRLPVTVR